MREKVKSDLYRYKGNASTKGFLGAFFKFPGFRFIFLKRICEYYGAAHPFGLLARLWYKRLQSKFGFQIPHIAKIDGGLFMGHFGNIVINQNVVVGSNCNVAQGVTIGYVSRGKRQGTPVIGERVWIGANAVVVGNIKIGNDVLIAPLTFVNFDIPDNAVVSGNPAQIINMNSSRGYIKHVRP